MIDDLEETFPVDRWRDQPERTPRAVERLVNAVGVDSSLDEVMTALDAAEWLAARSKLILTIAKKATVEWIEQNGEFSIGRCATPSATRRPRSASTSRGVPSR